MISDKTVSGITERGMKKSSGGGEFKYDIFDTLRTFANMSMYPHPAQQ
jgi:hypothetical protein